MRFFLDSEFIERGYGQPLHLISLGIVAQDGREFYGVNRDCPRHLANDWVKRNVLPRVDFRSGLPVASFRRAVLEFVGDDERPEFWSAWADYDWVLFCQLMGPMADLPPRWPRGCMDLQQWSIQLGGVKAPPRTKQAHDALVDARWHRDWWRVLERAAMERAAPVGYNPATVHPSDRAGD